MKPLFKTALLSLGLALSAGAHAIVDEFAIGFSPRTGDTWVDARLGDINVFARGNTDGFIDDVVVSYGALAARANRATPTQPNSVRMPTMRIMSEVACPRGRPTSGPKVVNVACGQVSHRRLKWGTLACAGADVLGSGPMPQPSKMHKTTGLGWDAVCAMLCLFCFAVFYRFASPRAIGPAQL